jgi:hypothetical protein
VRGVGRSASRLARLSRLSGTHCVRGSDLDSASAREGVR